ncbi:MAG: hypothetical protein ACREJ3_04240 [Polyangiaceae bacterium]
MSRILSIASALVLSALLAAGCSGSKGAAEGNDAGTDGASSSSGGTGSGSGSGGADGSGSGSDSGPGSEAGPICGSLYESCCSGLTCGGALSCRSGICQVAPSNGTGQACSKNSDCPSGICQPVGDGNVCTTTCSSVGDCVAGWKCASELGQSSNACQCKSSPEVCDGKDNDCDGIVDDGTANAQCGPGYACQSPVCVNVEFP